MDAEQLKNAQLDHRLNLMRTLKDNKNAYIDMYLKESGPGKLQINYKLVVPEKGEECVYSATDPVFTIFELITVGILIDAPSNPDYDRLVEEPPMTFEGMCEEWAIGNLDKGIPKFRFKLGPEGVEMITRLEKRAKDAGLSLDI